MNGESFARFRAGIQDALETHVGPVENEPYAVDPCPDDAIYRVPWPAVGGDVAYWLCHLARYREQHPGLWERVQEATGDNLSAFATRGNRFLSLADIPTRIWGGRYRRVGLAEVGYALYEQTAPDENALVTAVPVNRELEIRTRCSCPDYATRARSAGSSNYCCHRQVRCSSGQEHP